MTQLSVAVRAATRKDLLLLERHLAGGPPEKHADRLERQQRGEVVYLVAWHEDVPIGHALLKWQGAAEDYIAAMFQGTCPDVEDLYVTEVCRSQGVGTQILREAARLVAERGFRNIGLGVDVNNPRAQALYRRLGFQDSGLEPHYERYEYVDREGHSTFWEETCLYLVKPL